MAMRPPELHIHKWLCAAVHGLLRPVACQPVVFVAVLLLFGGAFMFDMFPLAGHLGVNRYTLATLAVVVVWGWLCSALAMLGHLAKVGIYVVSLLLRLVMLFCVFNFDGPVTAESLYALVATNHDEAREFVGMFVLSPATAKAMAIIVAAAGLIVLGELFRDLLCRLIEMSFVRTMLLLSLGCALGLFIAYAMPAYKRIIQAPTGDLVTRVAHFNYYPDDDFSRLMLAARIFADYRHEFDAERTATEAALGQRVSRCAQAGELHLLVVIGESYIKRHAHAYGYSLPTTPNIDRERADGNLVLFDDAITTLNTTNASLKNFLSTNNSGAGEMWYQCPFFIPLFRQAGYYVTSWDNQKGEPDIMLWDYGVINGEASVYLRRVSFNLVSQSTTPHDLEFVTNYARFAMPQSRRHRLSLDVLHLKGQHVNASDRYPATRQWQVFDSTSIKRTDPWLTPAKKQCIACYDNATRYNDHVLARLMDLWRNSSAVIVYFSDHGEEVFDVRDHQGRTQSVGLQPAVLHCQYDVPLMVWCSPRFQQQRPEVMQQLRKAARRPVMLDDLCHMLMHLGQVHSPCYKACRDVLSPSYRHPRRILQGGVDYDRIDLLNMTALTY